MFLTSIFYSLEAVISMTMLTGVAYQSRSKLSQDQDYDTEKV